MKKHKDHARLVGGNLALLLIGCDSVRYTAEGHMREKRYIQGVSNKLYNFGSLYKFIQRTCTVFWTVIMYQNTSSFISMLLPVSWDARRGLQWTWNEAFPKLFHCSVRNTWVFLTLQWRNTHVFLTLQWKKHMGDRVTWYGAQDIRFQQNSCATNTSQ
jgi:hypothetical protein